MGRRILIVEDDSNLVLTLSDALTAEGYAVRSVDDGSAAVTAASSSAFDLVLLDVGLPRQDGFAVCRELRDRGVDTPVLMLTGRAKTSDKILGLKLGADDYLTKPFDEEELLARIDAVLRRARSQQVESLAEYRFGGVSVDFVKCRALRDGRPVSLSGKELQLLRHLIARRGCVLDRQELLSEVWGYKSTATRTVDMHIAMLRQKLEDDPQHPRYILTVRGEGYLFRD